MASEGGVLKLLHVHSGNMYGGVERVLATLAGTDPAVVGVENVFALCFDGAVRGELEGRGAAVRSIGEVRLRNPLTVLAARRRLRAILARERPDAVVIHSAWGEVVFGGIVAQSRVCHVHWVHDVLDGRHWLQRLAGRRKPDLIVASSDFIASRVPIVFAGRVAHTVYCPLEHVPIDDPAARRAVRGELNVGPTDVVICQVGRLEPGKGQMFLLEALGELRDVPDWVCWQVGGPQRPWEETYLKRMKVRAKELSIADRVRFLGSRSDVDRLLAAADVYCQPNIAAEAFGLTFVEAMHAGLPVVTSDFGGGAEVVADQGWLVEPGNRAELAEVLGRLVADESLRRSGAAERPKRAMRLTDPVRQTKLLARLVTETIAQRNKA